VYFLLGVVRGAHIQAKIMEQCTQALLWYLLHFMEKYAQQRRTENGTLSVVSRSSCNGSKDESELSALAG